MRQTFSFWFGRGEEGEEAQLDPVDPGRTARQDVDNRALGKATFEAMDRLPERQRMVFSLRYLDGLELKAIAESMAISEGAVKAHLWHAAQKMREWLMSYRNEETLQ